MTQTLPPTNAQRMMTIFQSAISVLAAGAMLWTVTALNQVGPLAESIKEMRAEIQIIDADLKLRTAKRFTKDDGRNLREDINRDMDDIRRRLSFCERRAGK